MLLTRDFPFFLTCIHLLDISLLAAFLKPFSFLHLPASASFLKPLSDKFFYTENAVKHLVTLKRMLKYEEMGCILYIMTVKTLRMSVFQIKMYFLF